LVIISSTTGRPARRRDPAPDRRRHVGGILDPLAVRAEFRRHPGVVSREPIGAEARARGGHVVIVAAHPRVVQQDRHDRQALAHRRLDLRLHEGTADGVPATGTAQ